MKRKDPITADLSNSLLALREKQHKALLHREIPSDTGFRKIDESRRKTVQAILQQCLADCITGTKELVLWSNPSLSESASVVLKFLMIQVVMQRWIYLWSGSNRSELLKSAAIHRVQETVQQHDIIRILLICNGFYRGKAIRWVVESVVYQISYKCNCPSVRKI